MILHGHRMCQTWVAPASLRCRSDARSALMLVSSASSSRVPQSRICDFCDLFGYRMSKCLVLPVQAVQAVCFMVALFLGVSLENEKGLCFESTPGSSPCCLYDSFKLSKVCCRSCALGLHSCEVQISLATTNQSDADLHQGRLGSVAVWAGISEKAGLVLSLSMALSMVCLFFSTCNEIPMQVSSICRRC